MRKSSLIVSVLVFLSVLFIGVSLLPEARAATLYVGGSGPSNYTTIQGAVNDANPGDTVFVYNGTYIERVTVGKTLTLIGEERNTTTINGNGDWIPLNISADWVNVTGFSITRSGPNWDDPGMQLTRAHHARITNNSFWINRVGISLFESNESLIAHNNLTDINRDGIEIISSSNNTIDDNNISDGSNTGIGISDSVNITISNNTLWNNDDGMWMSSSRDNLVVNNNISGRRYGIVIISSGFNTIRNNTASSHGMYGIYLWYGNNNTVSRNTATGNEDSNIYLNYSDNNTIANNSAMYGWYGMILHSSSGNNIVSNNISQHTGTGVFLYFQSANNTINGNDVSDNGAGIVLSYSNHNSILNNTCLYDVIRIGDSDDSRIIGNNISLNDAVGLYVTTSDRTLIDSNVVLSNGHDGIEIYFSSVGRVINNTVSSNWASGIGIGYTDSITASGNVLIDDGIVISGNALPDFNSHTIDTSNTVNGRPVRYWKNLTSGVVPTDAGQVILANCTGVTVEDQNISRTDYGIQLGVSSGNIIRNNNVSSNDWYGIHLSYSDMNTISNNTAWTNRRGIRLFHSDGNAIANNNASWNEWSGIYLDDSSNDVLTDNTASHNNVGIDLYRSTTATLLNNKMIRDGIFIWGDLLGHWNTHNIDTTNIVNNKPVQYLKDVLGGVVPSGAGQVILANCNGVIVENQNVSNGTVGIILGFSSSNTIQGIIASSNNLYGMHLYSSRGNTIRTSNVSFNAGYGIHLYASLDNVITNNDAFNNEYGISIREHSDNNTLDSNRLSSSQFNGITISYSDGNRIVGNNISYNRQGIFLGSSNNNMVFHNIMLDNLVQGGDNRNTNQWDDGYPSGGNYWSDYTGVDNNWGPNQDQPGSDGIGDTPYDVDSDTQDRYPLMSPFAPTMRPPTVVDAVLDGRDLENVTIQWSLSPDDGLGLLSVVGYDVYRNTTYEPGGSSYQLIASLPNQTSEFTDSYVGEGDPNNYFYRICAIDVNNTTSCAGDQAGKFTQSMAEGPNLVSVPLIQSNTSVARVLQTAKFDKAWTYRAHYPNDQWRWFMTFKTWGDLRWINHSVGVWVNVTEGSNLTVAGLVPAQTTMQLHKGWNLVSFPSFNSSYTVSDLKAEVPVERVEAFDSSVPPHFLAVLVDSDVLLAGQGYWVKTNADATWVVSNA